MRSSGIVKTRRTVRLGGRTEGRAKAKAKLKLKGRAFVLRRKRNDANFNGPARHASGWAVERTGGESHRGLRAPLSDFAAPSDQHAVNARSKGSFLSREASLQSERERRFLHDEAHRGDTAFVPLLPNKRESALLVENSERSHGERMTALEFWLSLFSHGTVKASSALKLTARFSRSDKICELHSALTTCS